MTPLINTSVGLLGFALTLCALSVANSVTAIPSILSNWYGDNKRPRVDITVQGITSSWLYDTGACRTCISTKKFFKWFGTNLPKAVNPSSPVLNLRDAGGNSLGFRGVYNIPLTIMGKTVIHEVWVCDKITDLIIGVDFIQIHKLAYDCTSRSVHWNNEPHAPVLTLREETTFEPLTTTLISTKFLGKFDKNTTQIVSIFSIEDEFIQGGPALVYVSDSGLCTVAVTNCAPYPIQLKRGSVIGLIQDECCAQDEIEPLSDTKVMEIFESINLICAHATSSHKWTRDDIASKIQLNVPTEFRSKYLDLLFKHRCS